MLFSVVNVYVTKRIYGVVYCRERMYKYMLFCCCGFVCCVNVANCGWCLCAYVKYFCVVCFCIVW